MLKELNKIMIAQVNFKNLISLLGINKRMDDYMTNEVFEETQEDKVESNSDIPVEGNELLLADNVLWHDLLFYVIAVITTLTLAGFYLLNQSSGGNAAWVGLPLDDGWIHLSYARSLAENGWFYYNPGEAEAGMSSPAWVIILGFAYKVLTPLNVSPQWCAKGLSLLFAIGVPILVYHLAKALKLDRKWAWAAGLLAILEPNLAYGNVAGMEVSMFTFLTLLALLLSWYERYILAGLVLGLMVITRGEGTLNALIIGIIPLGMLYFKGHQNLKFIDKNELFLGLKLFLPSFLLGIAWVIYNYSINGHPLPNSYYVKHNFALGYFNLENIINVIQGYLGHLLLFKGIMLPLTITLLIIAIYALYHNKQLIMSIPLILIPFIQLYAFSINIKVLAVATPWTYFTRRYMDFIIPILILLIIVALDFLWKAASRSQNRFIITSTPLLMYVVIIFITINLFQFNKVFIEEYSWNTDNIEKVEVEMGKWVRDNIPANASIAVTDAGAVRFWSRPDHRIIDFMGLNSYRCIGRPSTELLKEFKPEYAVFFREAVSDSNLYHELHSVKTIRNTVLGGNELVAVKVLNLSSTL
ncbi:MAG: hypothetical protein PHC92_10925 [Syntrophomonadaceae bacterium]|nr:hypothetical protein [Syntrophomonadaceae bacterium]